MKTNHSFSFFLLLSTFLVGPILGQPECSPFFSDHMVIQRGMPIAIDGRAAPDGHLTAELKSLDATFTAMAQTDATGAFVVRFPELPAGGPYELTIQDADGSVALQDIMIGDIWICSGQSNMAWPLSQVNGGQEAIERSHNPNIRLFTVPRAQANAPSEELIGGPWLRSSPASTPDFSAVGYFFGRELQQRSGVPIGLINSSWGGTRIEPWTHADAFPDAIVQKPLVPKVVPSTPATPSGLSRADEDRLNAFLQTLPKAKTVSPYNALIRSSANPIRPGQIYNAMIHPLTRYPICGAIWYQGESNASQAVAYRSLFPQMIEDWRKRWNQPDFPFLYVQLANFMERMDTPQESNWAALREAQSMTLSLPHTGMAVTIDIGEADDIHPRNKLDVGRRLALHALDQVYSIRTGPVDGPVLVAQIASEDELTLFFENASEGLELREPVAGAFAIADEKGPFHWADVHVDGEAVILGSPEVANPVHVRYAWANNPTSPLTNASGLPASPFRTDDRPLTKPTPAVIQSADFPDVEDGASVLESQDWIPAGNARIAVSGFQAGNPGRGVVDGDPVTRWSAEGLDVQLLADLGASGSCREIGLQFFSGDKRNTIFKIEFSQDGESWEEAFYGASSGQVAGEEIFPVTTESVRFVLLTFYGNSENLWSSVNEIRFIP